MNDEIDKPTRKLNRYNSKRNRPGLFWCWKCDRSAVANGQKCSLCGALQGRKSLKPQDNLTT